MPRWMEITLAIFFLLLTSPLWIILVVWIKLDSNGPVFFRQLRVGKGGLLFWLWKFRGMAENGANGNPYHSSITVKGDPRVTRAGRFLRATKMDELPQFLNILKGEMSFVGPRPEIPEMVHKYPPRALEVLTFNPGLTCPGTLTYVLHLEEYLPSNGEAEEFYLKNLVEKKARLDLMYLYRRNIPQDLKLIFVSTPWIILKRTMRQFPQSYPKAGRMAESPSEAILKREEIPA